jgi:hypothetical protein
MSEYTLIWFDTKGKRTKTFSTFELAEAYAEANVSPSVNGSTCPNVPDGSYDESRYESGCYYERVNLYAVILHKAFK